MIISLNEERAEREQNAKLWTPLEALKALVRDLESGAMPVVDGVYVAMLWKDGDNFGYPFWTAGMSALEIRGMLTQHLWDICHRARSG